MRRPSPWLAACVLALAVALAADRDGRAAVVSDEEVHAVARQLRCVVCQNLSVADSPSEMAHQMRDLIRARLAAGERPDQVLAYFVERYGEWVLLAPPARGLNLFLWLAPFAAVAGGLTLLLIFTRRWQQQAKVSEPTPLAITVNPEERARLVAELERLRD